MLFGCNHKMAKRQSRQSTGEVVPLPVLDEKQQRSDMSQIIHAPAKELSTSAAQGSVHEQFGGKIPRLLLTNTLNSFLDVTFLEVTFLDANT